ncbi:MAG: hypothetical protein LBI53_02115 [Candidatus Peribacteria bacterium]|nr:hypothetical protein [Candidatus Peribacteria bacterium]
MDEQEMIKLIGKDLETKIEEKISKEYAEWLKNLQEDVNVEIQRLTNAIKNEKDPAEKKKLEAELRILKNDFKQSMRYLNSEKGMKTMTNKMKIDFVGIMYQHMTPAGADPSHFL